MHPHQKRVVHEKAELDAKLAKLNEFIQGPTFATLSLDEQGLLMRQSISMKQYSGILGERIAAFAT